MQRKITDPRLGISPARAYLVGGVPRSGKSTFAKRFLQQHPMFSASTDSIRSIQRHLLLPDEYPALFAGSTVFHELTFRDLCLTGRVDEIVDIQNSESEIVWDSVKQFIEAHIAEGYDVLVEGVAILPKFLSTLNCQYEAIFLGNSAQNRPGIAKAARENPLDWMHHFQDDTLTHFSQFTMAHSKYFEKESKLHNFQYYEITDENFSTDIDAAIELFAMQSIERAP